MTQNPTQNHNANPPSPSTSSPAPRTPKVGEAVLYREGEHDLHAIIASLDRDNRATLAVLGRHGIFRAVSSIARCDEPVNGSWRFA